MAGSLAVGPAGVSKAIWRGGSEINHAGQRQMTTEKPNQYAELRAAVQAVCEQYNSAYWQKVDEARGYPEALVDALTKAGWLAALIPEQYGGRG